MSDSIDTRSAICRLLERTHCTSVHFTEAFRRLGLSPPGWSGRPVEDIPRAIDLAERANNLRPFLESIASDSSRAELLKLLGQYEEELATPSRPALIDPDSVTICGPEGTSLQAQRRLFSEHYDSVRQAAVLARAPDNAARSLSARLRLDLLLTRCLVLTDAQVLDGPLLHALALGGELAALATAWGGAGFKRPMIEVRTRGADLNGSLIAMVGGGPSTGTFKPFLFALLGSEPEGLASEVAKSLANLSAKDCDTPEKLADTLATAGAPKERVEAMSGAWRKLHELSKDVVLRRAWPAGTFQEAWEEAFKADPLGLGSRVQFESPWGRKVLLGEFQSLSKENDRTRARSQLSRWRDAATTDEARRDVRRVELWYDRNYNRAIAIQHECASEWMSLSDDPVISLQQDVTRDLIQPSDGELMEKIRARHLVVDVGERFSERLADLPAEAYVRFLCEPEVSGALEAWYAKGHVEQLKNVLDSLSRVLEQVKPGGPVEEFALASRSQVKAKLREDGRSFELKVRFLIDDASLGQRTMNHIDVPKEGNA